MNMQMICYNEDKYDKNTFCFHAGTLCQFLAFQAPSPLSRAMPHYLRNDMFLDYLSDSVSNGKKVLDRLEVQGSGFVRETVEQGFLKSQVRRVERLEDVRF